MVTVEIETHGCKLNTADSQQIASEFLRGGFALKDVADETPPDVYVLNSCTVTHVADKKARQSISSARRRYPNALTVLTGCYPERAHDEVAGLHSVDLVLGNARKPELVMAIAERLKVDLTPCSDGREIVQSRALLGRTRASVKIQEGCDQVCAYCIVPKVRGRERSIPIDRIVDRVKRLEAVGCREVVFTGTQLGHYGFDLDGSPDLTALLRSVLARTSMPRIRVSSLQPPEIDDGLLDVWTNEGSGRLCRHFHMPLQSGSDEILSRMRRTYSSGQFLEKVNLVRRRIPGCGVTTDVIAGFPGETEADHRASVETMKTAAFSDAHVFPYSPRPGTSAFHFGQQIEPFRKADRAKELRNVAGISANRYRESSLDGVFPVLWEGRRGASGMTDTYMKVRMDNADVSNSGDGLIEDVELVQVEGDGVVLAAPV